jgi:hypothetical protein
MGFVTDMFDSDKGAGFQAQKANILQPVNTSQTQNAYDQTQGGMAQQQAFLNALGGQGGIQNQSSVFNQQQGLANMLGAQAMGYGPNPAMAQLAQTTGQNTANQAALMAGQRGSGANAGLLARQAGQQGAGIQQNAVGQAAVMRAQQQLAAQQALQGQQANMANLAGTQVSQQANTLQNYNTTAQQQQQALLNALANYNNTNVTMQSNVNNANAGLANTNAQGQQAMFGGALKGASSFLNMGMAHGGEVQHFDGGGMAEPQLTMPSQSMQPHFEFDKPLSFAGNYLSGNQVTAQPVQTTAAPAAQAPAPAQAGTPGSGAGAGAEALYSGTSSLGSALGEMPGKLIKMGMSAFGGGGGGGAAPGGGDSGGGGSPMSGMSSMLPLLMMAASAGGHVPGKAKVGGDDLKNDTVPAMLSPGEVVIPRSVMSSKDPVGNAAKFVQAVLSKKRK